jgi:hypothetical protein
MDGEENFLHGTPKGEFIRYRGADVDWPLLRSLSIEGYSVGSKNTVLWDVFMAVSMIDVFWDFEPRDSPMFRRYIALHLQGNKTLESFSS